MAVLYACAPCYSLQMAFQNAHAGSIIVLLVGKARVVACISQVGEHFTEMLSDVPSLGNSMKSNSQFSVCSILSYSLLDTSAAVGHLTVYIFTYIPLIIFTAVLWYRSLIIIIFIIIILSNDPHFIREIIEDHRGKDLLPNGTHMKQHIMDGISQLQTQPIPRAFINVLLRWFGDHQKIPLAWHVFQSNRGGQSVLRMSV